MVYIGIPTYNGEIHYKCVAGLVQTALICGQHKIGFAIDVIPHDAFIGKARNTIAHRFLQAGFEDLVYVDADIGFHGESLARLCMADADIVMGLYLMKSTKRQFPALIELNGDGSPIQHPKNPELVKLRYGPAGFMKVKRRVFEKMAEKWPDEWYGDADNPKIHDFFPHGRFGHDFTGEDIAFCNRAVECGFDIWALQGVELKHIGEQTWVANWRVTLPNSSEPAVKPVEQTSQAA